MNLIDALRSRQGYIALLSVLMVGAIAAMAVIVLFMTSLNTSLNSADVEEGTIARNLADACAERGLQMITDQRSTTNSCHPSGTPCNTIWQVAGQGTCTLRAVYHYGMSGSDTLWRVRATGSGVMNTLTKYVEAEIYRPEPAGAATGSAGIIMNWNECINFSQPITSDCVTE